MMIFDYRYTIYNFNHVYMYEWEIVSHHYIILFVANVEWILIFMFHSKCVHCTCCVNNYSADIPNQQYTINYTPKEKL